MKKGISFALIATLLVGCGSSNTVNYSTEVTDGDKTIISGDDVEITKNDIYYYILEQYGSSEILTLALTYIADQEITDEQQIQAGIDEQVASYTESLTMSFEDYAKQSGYESSQEYIDDVITDGVKQNFLFGENHRKLGKVAAGKSQCSCKGKVSFLACSDSDMRTKAF